jgi:hypothetical protein
MENSQHFRQTQIEEEMSATQTSGDNVRFTISSLYIPEGGMANQRSNP